MSVLCADMKPFDAVFLNEGFSYMGVEVLLINSLKLGSFRILASQHTNCAKKEKGGKDTVFVFVP